MDNRTSDLEDYQELKFSREQGFFDRSWAIRCLIAAGLALALFIVFHFREIHVEVLEYNTLAPRYFVAQTDFDFLDVEATALLKQEAIRDIGKIYQIDEKQIRQREIEFENFLMYNQEWRKYIPNNTFEEMFRSSLALSSVLTQARFTDPRTVQLLKNKGFSTKYYLIYNPPDLKEEVILPDTIWKYFGKKALPPNTYNEASSVVILGFYKAFAWRFEEDLSVERLLRRRLQEEVPPQYTHVVAGKRILDKGEAVTASHIAMFQAMKKALSEKRNLWHPLTLFGSLVLALFFTVACGIYFQKNYPNVFYSNRKLALVVTVAVITLIFSKLIEFFLVSSQSHLVNTIRFPIFVAFCAILLSSLVNAGVAAFTTIIITIILTISLVFEPHGFLLLNTTAAIVAIISTHALRRRKEIFVVCTKAWLCCVAMIFAMHFSQNIVWNRDLGFDIISTGIFFMLTAIAVLGVLPLLESFFRVMTDVTLTEYLNPNNDLLRQLTIEAPGTYQHSVVVGNIAEAAAVAIGANGLFCRVATLYHDIGKMLTPQYFTENQQSGVNIHQLLTPQESAAAIIAHVSEGVALARKAGLPEPFIDIIKEHHGTTLVYYFYRKELERFHGDKSKVNEADFRYSGPTPRSKESVIIMLADSLEAAARSLDTLNESALTALADQLIQYKQEDGQFDHCKLTLEELAIVKTSLVKTVIAFAHNRVKYPSREHRSDIPSEIYDS